MPNLKIVAQMGSTDAFLREIFSSKPVSQETNPNLSQDEADRINRFAKTREDWETKIQGRLQAHCDFALKNHHLYSAVDLAWDAPPVTQSDIPLLLYAQGALNQKSCVSSLKRCTGTDDKCNSFLRKDDGGNEVIDIPKFVKTNLNLVRSFVTRRLAAQASKYSNLYPYYKYEARGTSATDQLKADVLSQRVDAMVDDYGYRNHDIQVLRNALLYAQSIDFIASKWDTQRSVTGIDYDDGTKKVSNIACAIDKEGLDWVTPHPLRAFWDNASPISAINTGELDYMGYWDVVPFRALSNNPNFYNTDDVTYGDAWVDVLTSHAEFFNLYYNTTVRSDQFTATEAGSEAGGNDRANNIGRYAGYKDDAGCRIAQYFEKVIPKDVGLGGYTEPIWIRFVVAGEKTVIHAEFLPSRPGAYCGYNVKDDRQVNISFAHEVMPFQDQMSNLVTQMLDAAKRAQFAIYEIDEDFFDDDQVKEIRSKINSSNWDMSPMSISVSRTRLSDVGVDMKRDPIRIIQPSIDPQSVQIVFNAMVRMIELAERVTAMSANEIGQPISKSNGGVTATEADQIGQTTNNVHGFVSEAFDEFRAAKKRIIADSLVECHQGQVIAPVLRRYPVSTAEAAGFTLEEIDGTDPSDIIEPGTLLKVSAKALNHNYIYTSRDGSERSNNINAANALVNLMQVVKDPMVLEAVGKPKLFEMLNSIFRMMDAGIDLNLEVEEGDEGFVNQSDEIIATIQKLQELVVRNQQQISGIVQQIGGEPAAAEGEQQPQTQ